MVKLGAQWIRDIKSRLKLFCQTLFNLETGDFRDNVVRSDSLKDTGVTPGTYNKVQVNSKGQAIAAFNEDLQQTGVLYLARFEGTAGTIDTANGAFELVTGTGGTYSGSGAPYEGTYAGLNGASYTQYSLTVPDGVRRVKVTAVGGGGGCGAVTSGLTAYSNAANGGTTTTGTWGWITVGPGTAVPLDPLPIFTSQGFRIKDSGTIDASERLSFDNGSGGSVAGLLLPGLLLQNQRTLEIVRVVSFDTGTTWIVERAQQATTQAAVLDNDQWRVLVRYGGAGGEHVEGTLPVTPGETLSIVVGRGGAEAQAGGTSAVISGSAHIEAGGGGASNSITGGAAVTGAKSSNVSVIASGGSPGLLTAGGRSGSYLRITDGWHGDGGGYTGLLGQDGLVLIEWIA